MRRSSRLQINSERAARDNEFHKKVQESSIDGLLVIDAGHKGRGVAVSRQFDEGEYVATHDGKTIPYKEAVIRYKLEFSGKRCLSNSVKTNPPSPISRNCIIFREQQYKKENKGCYLMFFKFNSKRLCIDATEEDGSLGRLINHSLHGPNLKMKVVTVDDKPRVVFIASRTIKEGEELLYDYGEQRKAVIEANPWLR